MSVSEQANEVEVGPVTSGQGPEHGPQATTAPAAPVTHLDRLCRQTHWKSRGSQAACGRVRNAYVHFSKFVLFHYDWSDFLKLIFGVLRGISIHAYSLLLIFMAFISVTFLFMLPFLS